MKFKNILEMILKENFQEVHNVTPSSNIKTEMNKPVDNNIENFHIDNILHSLRPVTEKYTGFSKDFNRNLWKISKGTELEDDKEILQNTNAINRNLLENTPATKDFHVYSGVRRNPQELVKDSGGILHHAAFLSTSLTPQEAIKFSDGENGSRHVLKIKIRKGQHVGSYLGNKSIYPEEKEFLITSNQLLHIHPDYNEYTNSKGHIVKVHHAIILEPHEYEQLSNNKEVDNFKNFKNMLDDNKQESEIENEMYIKHELGKDNINDTNFIKSKNLSKKHIDYIIKHHPSLHEDLAMTYTLDKNQLEDVFKANNTRPGILSYQKNLEPRHVKYLLGLHNSTVDRNLALNSADILNNDHINTILSRGKYLNHLANNKHLTNEHIDTLLSKNNNGIDRVLASNRNLTADHINVIINRNNKYSLPNISKRTDLTDEHISKILHNYKPDEEDYDEEYENIPKNISRYKSYYKN